MKNEMVETCKEISLPGSTETNFINRFVQDWYSENSGPATYPEICNELSGIARWHRIICSTPMPWLSVKPLGAKIYQEMIRVEAVKNPWITNCAERDMSNMG